MPYDPHAIDQDQRENSYRLVWFSAAGAVANVAFAFTDWQNIAVSLAIGLTVVGLVNAAYSSRTDDYFAAMCANGTRWLLMGLSAYIFALFILNIADISYSAGFALANPEATASGGNAAMLFNDARLLASGLALLFYAGYAQAWLRNKREG